MKILLPYSCWQNYLVYGFLFRIRKKTFLKLRLKVIPAHKNTFKIITLKMKKSNYSCFIPLGLDSEMIMKPLVTEINAKLRNIIVLDSDKMAVYKKVSF